MTEDPFPSAAAPAAEGVVWGEMVEGPAHGKRGTGPSVPGPDRFPQAIVRWGFLFLVGGLVLCAAWLAVGVVEALQAENEWRLVSVRVTRVVAPAAAVLVFAAALATRAYRGETRRLWHLSYAMVAIFVAGIATIWIVLVREPYRPYPEDVVILTPEQREAFPQSRPASGPGAVPAAVIPTGVFIRTTEFERTENVRKSGYIWQKYADGLPEGLSRGFVLPDAVEQRIQEAYRRRVGDVETIGWYFEVETRATFNYTRFPFDIKDPWVRITPRTSTPTSCWCPTSSPTRPPIPAPCPASSVASHCRAGGLNRASSRTSCAAITRASASKRRLKATSPSSTSRWRRGASS